MMGAILIVDDQEELLWLHREILSKAGYRTVGAANGIEAQRVVRLQRIALILSDIQMPKMCGIELLNWTKLNHPEIPLVLCSGMGPPDCAEGHKAFLQKPITETELISTIKKVLKVKS